MQETKLTSQMVRGNMDEQNFLLVGYIEEQIDLNVKAGTIKLSEVPDKIYVMER